MTNQNTNPRNNIQQVAPMHGNGQGIPMGVPLNYNSHQQPQQPQFNNNMNNNNNQFQNGATPYNNPNSFNYPNSNQGCNNSNTAPCTQCGGQRFRVEDNTNCCMLTLGVVGLLCCICEVPFNLVFVFLIYWAMKGYKKRYCQECNTELPYKNDFDTMQQ